MLNLDQKKKFYKKKLWLASAGFSDPRANQEYFFSLTYDETDMRLYKTLLENHQLLLKNRFSYFNLPGNTSRAAFVSSITVIALQKTLSLKKRFLIKVIADQNKFWQILPPPLRVARVNDYILTLCAMPAGNTGMCLI